MPWLCLAQNNTNLCWKWPFIGPGGKGAQSLWLTTLVVASPNSSHGHTYVLYIEHHSATTQNSRQDMGIFSLMPLLTMLIGRVNLIHNVIIWLYMCTSFSGPAGLLYSACQNVKYFMHSPPSPLLWFSILFFLCLSISFFIYIFRLLLCCIFSLRYTVQVPVLLRFRLATFRPQTVCPASANFENLRKGWLSMSESIHYNLSYLITDGQYGGSPPAYVDLTVLAIFASLLYLSYSRSFSFAFLGF